MKPTWQETILSYFDKRLLWVFMLGISSGFPWVIVGSTMNAWLKDEGLDRASISYFGSVFAVYAINFLWAPLIDRVKLPFLHKIFGQRRSWILVCQVMILLGILCIAFINPSENLILTSALALGITLFSATKDIAIDAFRIDHFSDDSSYKLPQASSMATIGWWTGYSLLGYIGFTNANVLGWNVVYFIMSSFMLTLIGFTLIVKEPATNREQLQKEAEQLHTEVVGNKVISWLTVTIIEPFVDFFRRNGVGVALTLLLFVFLFKIGEAFLGRMSIVFYKEIGFSNEDIGYYSKLIGWGFTMLFTLIGSLINVRFGVVKGLIIGGIAMASSNLIFAWIALVGPDVNLFLATVIIDNFTTAFSTVAFVSFLTLMTGKAFSATQYALLASLGNFSRTTLSSFSGEFVNWLDTFVLTVNEYFNIMLNGWALFFIITALMVLPSLMMLIVLRKHFNAMIDSSEASNRTTPRSKD